MLGGGARTDPFVELRLTTMDPRPIREKLEEKIRRSRDLRDEAWAIFSAALDEVASGIPHPDGADRISLAARRFNYAYRECERARDELMEFIVNGIAPADLDEEVH